MKFHLIRNYSNFKSYALFVYNFFMSSKLIYIDWKKYYHKGSMPQKNEVNWINITAVSSSWLLVCCLFIVIIIICSVFCHFFGTFVFQIKWNLMSIVNNQFIIGSFHLDLFSTYSWVNSTYSCNKSPTQCTSPGSK